ncbi:MAG: MFS transporter, partial [Acidimicrobiales bacterium]
MTAVITDTRVPDGVWAPGRRRLTAGLVLTITLVAFESLAIATVMPVVSDDLGGLGLYGWVFSGFFLGSLLGIVLAGEAADRRGTRAPFLAGLVLFSIGLVIGGSAQSMAGLVAGRVAQGIGAGVIPAVAYASVGRGYPPELRPRVFAVFSSAWVIPGLIGPAAASAIERWTSWRVVFLALLPFVVLAAVMALPALSSAAPA